MAATMSSPGYSSTGSSLGNGTGNSGGSGLNNHTVAIGTPLYMPSDVTASSPNYISRQIAQVATGGDSGFLHTGDVNGNGVVDIVDVLLALKAGVGLIQLSAVEHTRADVGPLQNSVPVGNGRVDAEDALLILRRAVGLGR